MALVVFSFPTLFPVSTLTPSGVYRDEHSGIYGHEEKHECKETNVRKIVEEKIIILQINAISFTDILTCPCVCIHR